MQIATLEVRKVWKVRKFNKRLFFFFKKLVSLMCVKLNVLNGLFQKQPPEMFYKKRCSKKFRKIQRKTSVPEHLF